MWNLYFAKLKKKILAFCEIYFKISMHVVVNYYVLVIIRNLDTENTILGIYLKNIHKMKIQWIFKNVNTHSQKEWDIYLTTKCTYLASIIITKDFKSDYYVIKDHILYKKNYI